MTHERFAKIMRWIGIVGTTLCLFCGGLWYLMLAKGLYLLWNYILAELAVS